MYKEFKGKQDKDDYNKGVSEIAKDLGGINEYFGLIGSVAMWCNCPIPKHSDYLNYYNLEKA